METFTRVNGSMIKRMDSEYIIIPTVRSMKENGKKINRMEWEKSTGQTEHVTKANIS